MRRFVNPGNTAFEVAVNSQIYVDKTGLLAYTNSVINTKQALICSSTFADLLRLLEQWAAELSVEVEQYQSNHEGDLVDKIQEAYGKVDGIVINPAAYTHTSVAILDALKAVSIPAVEVHISDVDARESFRQISYAGMACKHTIKGQGLDGYRQAIQWLVEHK